MMIGQSAGKSYAYLLGVFLGDGCVTRVQGYPAFRLNTIDEDFALATKAALSEMTRRVISIHKHDVKKSSKPNHSLRCGDPEICAHLLAVTNHKLVIPAFVHDWEKGRKLAFIQGVMDSEGFVAGNGNTTNRRYYMGYKSCDAWVPDFIRILESVGIRIGKVSAEVPRRPGYKTPTRFAIKMQSWIDSGARFGIARKQKRVDEWASSGPYERRAKFPRRLTSEANMPDTAQNER
ncbi:MAG: hypothetical protein M0R03_20895 [Novosphingobium sp.]|nr:hypothetical protein [Novosphingobium sp.]